MNFNFKAVCANCNCSLCKLTDHPPYTTGMAGVNHNRKVANLVQVWNRAKVKAVAGVVVVSADTPFAKNHVLYEDKPYHNAVFVGRDENGMARHAHKRSTNSYGKTFRINIDGSDPRYSFHHIGKDGSLFVFEAPIDLMSFATMFPDDWQDHSYVACCGTSFQPVGWLLGQTKVDTAFLCLDNDKAGQEACERMEEELQSFGIGGERLIPKHKDWNEDLVTLCEQEQEAAQCQTMCGI